MSDSVPALRSRNNALAVVVIGVLGVMLIPMPPLVLDMLLCINISVSLLIMMTVLNTAERLLDVPEHPAVHGAVPTLAERRVDASDPAGR